MDTISSYIPSIESIASSINPIKKTISKYVELPTINPEYQSYIYQGPSLSEIAVNTFYSFVDSVSYLFKHTHPSYIFVAAIFICAAIFVYIKLKYPFWDRQPVLHNYDIWNRWISKPHICSVIPYKTKYYDKLKVIKTSLFENVSREKIRTLCELLQAHYISYDGLFCSITEKDMISYLGGQKSPISIWYEFEKPIGFITSRPLDFYIENSNISQERLYYYDMMCLMKTHEDKIHTLFQTHEYNQRILVPDIPIGLFKKEISLIDSIIPIISCKSSSYFLRNITIPKLEGNIYLVRVLKTNTDVIHNVTISYLKQHFPSLVVCPSVSAIIGLLNAGIFYLYVLKHEDTIIAYYFFKNANIVQDNIDGATISLVGSMVNKGVSYDLFYVGFLNSINMILKENMYKMILIDNISDNGILLERWNQKHTSIVDVDVAYYFYNYIYPKAPLDPKLCIVLL